MDYDNEFQYKSELIEYAEKRGVSTEGTRAEITERLVAQDEIEAAGEKDEAKAEVVDKTEKVDSGAVTTKDLKVEPSPPLGTEQKSGQTPAPDKDGKVLIRMTKPANLAQFGNHRFSRLHPFCLVEKDMAEMILDLYGFRRASAAEAAGYYESGS